MADLNALTKDLSTLPALIGNTGLAIAGAQKQFNLAFVEDLERLIVQIKTLLGTNAVAPEAATILRDMLIQLAPPRYQFTETEIEFRADLGQSMRTEAGGSLGVSVPAVNFNVSFSTAFGYDYQASAKVRTVIHAVTIDRAVLTQLLDRAAQIAAVEPAKMPAVPQVDAALAEASSRVKAMLTPKPNG